MRALALILGAALALAPVAAHARPALELIPLGRYETGVFDGSAAEIVAYDAQSQRLFVTNSNDAAIDVLDIRDQRLPNLVTRIDLTPFGAGPNSVTVRDGVVAVAVEADPVTDPGRVVFFDADGNLLGSVEVGPLPDMLTFTPDGSKILTANEGEPDNGVDPPGSVSIVDLSAGPANASALTVGFEAFDGREAEFRAKGVRIFPGVSLSNDVEPEYLTVTPDSATAVVTLQEQNALAIVDIAAAEIVDLVPLGVKDHSRGPVELRTFRFPTMPPLGTTATVNPADPAQTTAGQTIRLGGLSGLWFEGVDVFTGRYRFVTVPDRGPNGEPTDVDSDGENERPFALPDYQARAVHFELDPRSGAIEITDQVFFTRTDGATPISGLPNIPGVDEEPVDLFGNLLDYDPLGADMEGVVRSPDGHYWTVDEYRPAIYHFDEEGVLVARFVPEGTADLAGMEAGAFGLETLPAEYSDRRRNRGFEAIAFDPGAGVLYAFIQTPLANPDRAASDGSDVIRILAVDPATGTPLAEYVYLLEGADFRESKVDKIGDAVYAGDGRFYVIERDSATSRTAKKFLFEVDLAGATNLLADDAPALFEGFTLEQHSADALAELGIRPVHKRKVTNLPSIGYRAGDKPEGLALLPHGRLAVLNDNDFALLDQEIPGDGTVPFNPRPTSIVLGILGFTAGNGLDASDRDGDINIRNWPVQGLYMPDAIATLQARRGVWFLTANEGDARDEDARVADLALDPVVFSDPTLQDEANLGRLEVSSIDGDLDGDADYDRIHSYGARSFTVWDQFGNLVWDSSDELAHLTAIISPTQFNSTNDENGSFDSRSDAKGIEPEAIEVGFFYGRQYAFVGFERIGGIAVYDVTEPTAPEFVSYLNTRDFAGNAEAGTAGDLGPEEILYIPRDVERGVRPTLVVSYEVSGTVGIYRVQFVPES